MSDDTTSTNATAPGQPARDEWVEVPHEEMNLRAYRAAIVSFAVAMIGGLLAAAAYWSSETQNAARYRARPGARRHRFRARVVVEVPRPR